MSQRPEAIGLPRNKVALLHVAKRDLCLAEEDYRAILVQFGGVESAKELDLPGFDRVIAHLTRLGFKSTWLKRTYGHRNHMASPSQIDLMHSLWAEYYQGEADKSEAALQAWLFRYHQVSALRFVTAEMAKKVIPGLKAMAARNKSSE